MTVTPLWTQRQFTYGDPSRPNAAAVPPLALPLPAGSAYAVRAFVTGHGQGNADNCAEFCPRRHTIRVDDASFAADVWRTDCATTAVPNQPGTYRYSRAGWCPGALVHPWQADIAPRQSAPTFAYDVQDYTNSCRPGMMTCQGCTLGTGCDYDGGNHTEPSYQLPALLITYR